MAETPKFSFHAAYSKFSNGSEVPFSGNGSREARCALEMPIDGPRRGLRYLCVAMLHKKFGFPYYKPCNFDDGKCPLNQFAPRDKPDYAPLEIEKKWAKIKGNNLK